MKLNSWGFSLLEMMIAIGILGFISLVTMSMMTNIFKGVRGVNLSLEANEVSNAITLAIGSKQICQESLSLPNLTGNWAPQDLPLIRFGPGGPVIAEVGQVIGGLLTDRIEITRMAGPFPVRLNTADPSDPPVYENFNRYFVRMEVQQRKTGEVVGGQGMQARNYFVQALARNNGTGEVTECYGGFDRDHFQELCERIMGGEFDETRSPSCRITRLGLAADWDSRDNALAPGAVTAGAEGAFADDAGFPGLSVQGPISAERIFPAYGDIGGWNGGTTPRAWIGQCGLGGACVGGVNPHLNTDFLHISGGVNPNFPNTAAGNPGRVLGLYDHVVIPDTNAVFHLGTGGADPGPPNMVVWRNNPDANPIAWFHNRQTQGQITISGQSDGVADPTYAGVYLNQAGSLNSWAMVHKVTNNRFGLAYNTGSGWDERFSVVPLGAAFRVGINNLNPTVALDVVGSVRIREDLEVDQDITAGGTILATSDERLKTEIESLKPGALSNITKITPVSFVWKKHQLKTSSPARQVGFLAQDIEAQIPDAVETNEDGIKSISIFGVLSYLVAAFKELVELVFQNKGDISQLQEEVEFLQQEVQRLNKIFKEYQEYQEYKREQETCFSD